MLKRIVLAVAAAAAFGAAGGHGALAQTQFERAGAQRDWSVFATGEGDSRVCWIVSKPTASEARRNNQRVQANRGDIYLMVATRPAQNVRNEVSMVAGYTYRADSTVRVEIGSSDFTMFVQEGTAWPENAQADDALVAAMRRGSQAKVTGVSSRGTTTIDTFSLSGFSAALEESQRLCG
jgi:invasion protein IalB